MKLAARHLPLLHLSRVLAFTIIMGTRALAQDSGLVLPQDGGTYELFSDPIYSTCPDGLPVQSLDGGWKLLAPSRAARVACLMATCDTDRHERKEREKVSPPPMWWEVGAALLVGGATLGFMAGRYFAPAR